jgi:hypothetical protein
MDMKIRDARNADEARWGGDGDGGLKGKEGCVKDHAAFRFISPHAPRPRGGAGLLPIWATPHPPPKISLLQAECTSSDRDGFKRVFDYNYTSSNRR